MAKLKCFGGSNDGKYWECPDNCRHGDIIGVRKIPKIFQSQLQAPITPIKIETEYYEICDFHYYNQSWRFLILKDVDKIQLITELFDRIFK